MDIDLIVPAARQALPIGNSSTAPRGQFRQTTAVVLDPITDAGHPVKLRITAVTGDSALLSFALEQHP